MDKCENCVYYDTCKFAAEVACDEYAARGDFDETVITS